MGFREIPKDSWVVPQDSSGSASGVLRKPWSPMDSPRDSRGCFLGPRGLLGVLTATSPESFVVILFRFQMFPCAVPEDSQGVPGDSLRVPEEPK
eukprot:8311036-Pyramimonas_sp.AAC.1